MDSKKLSSSLKRFNFHNLSSEESVIEGLQFDIFLKNSVSDFNRASDLVSEKAYLLHQITKGKQQDLLFKKYRVSLYYKSELIIDEIYSVTFFDSFEKAIEKVKVFFENYDLRTIDNITGDFAFLNNKKALFDSLLIVHGSSERIVYRGTRSLKRSQHGHEMNAFSILYEDKIKNEEIAAAFIFSVEKKPNLIKFYFKGLEFVNSDPLYP